MSESTRMALAVKNIAGLVEVLAFSRGSWWHVFMDNDGTYQGRAYWSDMVQRSHIRLGSPAETMIAAAENLEWELRRDVADMHDFQVPTTRA